MEPKLKDEVLKFEKESQKIVDDIGSFLKRVSDQLKFVSGNYQDKDGKYWAEQETQWLEENLFHVIRNPYMYDKHNLRDDDEVEQLTEKYSKWNKKEDNEQPTLSASPKKRNPRKKKEEDEGDKKMTAKQIKDQLKLKAGPKSVKLIQNYNGDQNELITLCSNVSSNLGYKTLKPELVEALKPLPLSKGQTEIIEKPYLVDLIADLEMKMGHSKDGDGKTPLSGIKAVAKKYDYSQKEIAKAIGKIASIYGIKTLTYDLVVSLM